MTQATAVLRLVDLDNTQDLGNTHDVRHTPKRSAPHIPPPVSAENDTNFDQGIVDLQKSFAVPKTAPTPPTENSYDWEREALVAHYAACVVESKEVEGEDFIISRRDPLTAFPNLPDDQLVLDTQAPKPEPAQPVATETKAPRLLLTHQDFQGDLRWQALRVSQRIEELDGDRLFKFLTTNLAPQKEALLKHITENYAQTKGQSVEERKERQGDLGKYYAFLTQQIGVAKEKLQTAPAATPAPVAAQPAPVVAVKAAPVPPAVAPKPAPVIEAAEPEKKGFFSKLFSAGKSLFAKGALAAAALFAPTADAPNSPPPQPVTATAPAPAARIADIAAPAAPVLKVATPAPVAAPVFAEAAAPVQAAPARPAPAAKAPARSATARDFSSSAAPYKVDPVMEITYGDGRTSRFEYSIVAKGCKASGGGAHCSSLFLKIDG